MNDLIERAYLIGKFEDTGIPAVSEMGKGYDLGIAAALRVVKSAPSAEAEPVRHRKGCSYCKGRAYSKKPLTVITRTMKRVEVVFEYCPACGRKMDGGADNG